MARLNEDNMTRMTRRYFGGLCTALLLLVAPVPAFALDDAQKEEFALRPNR